MELLDDGTYAPRVHIIGRELIDVPGESTGEHEADGEVHGTTEFVAGTPAHQAMLSSDDQSATFSQALTGPGPRSLIDEESLDSALDEEEDHETEESDIIAPGLADLESGAEEGLAEQQQPQPQQQWQQQ